MSNIGIEDRSKDISLFPTEIVTRDQITKTIREHDSQFMNEEYYIVINLHPTDGPPWVLVIERETNRTYYFDSFGVETPPLFLQQ